MNLLIIDLYNDGECLRVVEDTPQNVQVLNDWIEHDRTHCNSDDPDYMGISDWLDEKGVHLFCTRTVDVNGPVDPPNTVLLGPSEYRRDDAAP